MIWSQGRTLQARAVGKYADGQPACHLSLVTPASVRVYSSLAQFDPFERDIAAMQEIANHVAMEEPNLPSTWTWAVLSLRLCRHLGYPPSSVQFMPSSDGLSTGLAQRRRKAGLQSGRNSPTESFLYFETRPTG